MKSRALPILYVLGLSAVVAFVAIRQKSPKKEATGSDQQAVTAHFSIVDGRAMLAPIPAGLSQHFSGQRAWDHVKALCDIGPRPPQSDGYKRATQYVEQQLAASGWVTRHQVFKEKTPEGETTFTNILARFRPKDSSWSSTLPTVISGHFDTKKIADFRFLGANDSGSSTGVILELARVLAADPASAACIELVLFDGEEAIGGGITPTDGLYGSKHYAREIMPREIKPSFAVVLDLVGDERQSFFFNPEATPAMAQAVTAAAREQSLNLSVSEGSIIDDHVPLQNAQLPCLHIIGDFTSMPYWHKKDDTLDTISAKALEKTGRVTLSALAVPLP